MRQYNLFQAILMSFYSRALYRDVALNWGGITFVYLLLVLALAWIPITAQIQGAINHGYGKHSDQLVNQIPVLTIKNGLIETPEKRPYFILDENGRDRLAVIDTTGQYTTNEQAKAPVLITSSNLVTQTKPNETRIQRVPENLNVTVVPQTVNQYLKDYIGYLWIFLYIFCVFFSFVYRIIQAILYSLMGLVFNSVCETHLTFGQIIKIAIVALTPVIVIATVLDFFFISFTSIYLCYLMLAMVYLFFGIYANKSKGTT